MQINFEKAHQLIDSLEDKLKVTVGHTGKARDVLEELRKNGEEGLRKKTAEALKLVRKKADSFVKSLTELESSLAKSLEKAAGSLEKPALAEKKAAPAAKAAKPAAKTPSKKVPAKKTVKAKPAAKKVAS